MSCQHGASLGTTILLACYLVAQWEVQMCACVSSDCQELAVQEELNGYKLSWVNLSQENMEDRVHGEQETQTSSPANRDNYKLLGLLQDGPMSFANWIASTVMIISSWLPVTGKEGKKLGYEEYRLWCHMKTVSEGDRVKTVLYWVPWWALVAGN